MCGLLDNYLQAFRSIHLDTDRNRWTEVTNFTSPCKPFLLLSVLDAIASGSISRNFIEPTPDLADSWQAYMALLPAINRQVSMAYPFSRLSSDRFWHLLPRAGTEQTPAQTMRSLTQLRECYFGAQFDDGLFPLLQMPTSREKLGAVLIETFFSPDVQPRLWQQSAMNYRIVGG